MSALRHAVGAAWVDKGTGGRVLTFLMHLCYEYTCFICILTCDSRVELSDIRNPNETMTATIALRSAVTATITLATFTTTVLVLIM